jgi:hypothetical protein
MLQHDRDVHFVPIGDLCSAGKLGHSMISSAATRNACGTVRPSAFAARVQALADSQAIFATGSVIQNPLTSSLLASKGLVPVAGQRELRGLTDEYVIYEIP